MLEELKKPKIVVVVGPTASGKTGVAIELAKRFNGEVVSADSRQVYRGMDIGTAKVTTEEMQGITHHLLDVASPTEVYTASDFARDAKIVIDDIISRGKLPIVAGGTFFYIDTLLGKISVPEVPPDQTLRATLEEKSAADLLSMLEGLDPDRAASIEPENKRRLIRAVEIATFLGKVPPPTTTNCPYEVLTVGLQIDMDIHGRIVKERIVERLDAGMIDEVKTLLYNGITHERLESFGLEYRYISRHLRGLMEYDEMVSELAVKTRQFAKRQMTWLKRDKTIQWFAKSDSGIFDMISEFLKD